MFHHDFSIANLIHKTIKSDNERAYVQHPTVSEFQQAITELDQAGLSQAQVQLLQRKPFSRFTERDYQEVMLIALAIRKQTTTVANIHTYLQEREYRARIYGNTIVIQTERLPGIEAINGYLGLSAKAD